MAPDENDLRASLHEGEPPAGSIDLDRVLRRTRARRRPKVLLAGAGGALAAAAIVVPVALLGTPATTGVSTLADAPAPGSEARDSSAGSGAESDASQPFADGGASISRAPADKLNLCAGTVAEVAPNEQGLVLEVQPLEAARADAPLTADVTLTNTGPAPVTGSTGGSPALTLSQDGLVLWHSNGPTTMIAVMVDLAPGESMEYTAAFEPVRCAVDDDLDVSFRDDLPEVDAGTYQLGAAIDLVSDDPAVGTILVTGPTTDIALR